MTAQPPRPTTGGIPMGRVGGAPVRIGYSWLLLAAILVFTVSPNVRSVRPDLGAAAYAVGLAVAGVLLVAVLGHEFAHALVARAFGARVVAIVADLFGGHTAFDGRALGPGRTAVVAVAGPLTNGALGLLFYLLTIPMDTGVPLYLLDRAAWVNLSLAGFNLLPGLPLDGGQLIESAVWGTTGNRHRGTVVAAWCGRVVTVLVVLWFVAVPLLRGQSLGTSLIWSVLIASFLWRGASAALTRGRVLGRLDAVTLSQLLVHLPVVGESDSVELAATRAPGGAVVVSGAGRPVGLVLAEGIAQVPSALRATTPVGAVLLRQPDAWVVEATGEDPLPVVQQLVQLDLAVAAVHHQGRLLGVLRTDDVQRVLAGGAASG